jgi:hypothetical protein
MLRERIDSMLYERTIISKKPELYLRWLNKHERHASEEEPLGIILCTGKQQELVELMDCRGLCSPNNYWHHKHAHLIPRNHHKRKMVDLH